MARAPALTLFTVTLLVRADRGVRRRSLASWAAQAGCGALRPPPITATRCSARRADGRRRWRGRQHHTGAQRRGQRERDGVYQPGARADAAAAVQRRSRRGRAQPHAAHIQLRPQRRPCPGYPWRRACAMCLPSAAPWPHPCTHPRRRQATRQAPPRSWCTSASPSGGSRRLGAWIQTLQSTHPRRAHTTTRWGQLQAASTRA